MNYLLNYSLMSMDMSENSNNKEIKKISKHLDDNGELMICLDNGEKIELHKHNVNFDEDNGEIIVNAGDETIWIPVSKIVYYKIHREGFEK